MPEKWKTGSEHETKGGTEEYRESLGPTHTDTYKTNDAGKRDSNSKHHEDMKVSGSKHEPSITDVHPPSDMQIAAHDQSNKKEK